MDMSLIAGMPEVIAYIRSQDERIKALKEENERLDKQRVLDIQRMMKGDEYKKENKSLKESARIQWQRADKYYESIKELTEENEKLKEELREAQNPSRETIKRLVEESFMCEPMSRHSNTQLIYHWYSDEEDEED